MGTTVGKENGGAMGSCNMNGNVNICNALSNSNTFSLTNPISINMNNPTTLTNLHLNQNQPHSTHQHHR
jgi:hypothetical protein